MLVSNHDILNKSQVEKLGNLAIYLANNTYELTKTKLLKLVYLCEESFVKKHASPFLGLQFQAWQFGPVQKELYVNLDVNIFSENNSLLSNYITYKQEGTNNFIGSLKGFEDGEFSDDEIEIMEIISKTYKYSIATELVFITHKGTSLWYKTVIREDGLMDRFENKIQTVSDLVLDFSELLENYKAKEFYCSQIELARFNNALKR